MNKLIKLQTGTTLALLAIIGGATSAFAVDPTPPTDPTAAATSALANFGDKALSTFGSLVTNAWVLAIFAFGIGLAFVSGVIRKIRGKVSHSVA
jgi:hypothetical protein